MNLIGLSNAKFHNYKENVSSSFHSSDPQHSTCQLPDHRTGRHSHTGWSPAAPCRCKDRDFLLRLRIFRCLSQRDSSPFAAASLPAGQTPLVCCLNDLSGSIQTCTLLHCFWLCLLLCVQNLLYCCCTLCRRYIVLCRCSSASLASLRMHHRCRLRCRYRLLALDGRIKIGIFKFIPIDLAS